MGLFMTALLSAATYEIYKDNRVTKSVIKINQEEAENLIARIDRNMDAAVSRCDNSLKKLFLANKAVYQSTFPNFVQVGSQLMNVDFDDRQEALRKVKKPEKTDYNISANSTFAKVSAFYSSTSLVSSVITPVVSLATQVVYSAKLKATLAESKTELASIKAAVEVAKLEIAKMRSITTLADTATETVKALQVLTDAAIVDLAQKIKTFGVNYNDYSEDAKNTTWLTFKMVNILNELVNMQILTPSGAISGKFRKFVGDVSINLLEN